VAERSRSPRTFVLATITMCALLSTSALAQSNAKWSRNGDALSTGDWLGSTNNISLLLKANNALGLKINTNGDVIIKALDLNNTTTNGLVLTNGQGKLYPNRLSRQIITNGYIKTKYKYGRYV
jgi:hypothetical protein